MPNFLLALLLIFLFGVTLRWLPISGYVDPLEEGWAGVRSLVLPAVTLGLALAAVVTRTLRSSLLDALAEDYVRTARAKGLAESHVIRRHVLKNALIPVVTVLGLQLGTLIGGAVITEYVFALPGVGRLVVDAVFARDSPLVQGVILLIAVGFIASTLLVDVLYGWIDPRTRLRCPGGRAGGGGRRERPALGRAAPGRARPAGAVRRGGADRRPRRRAGRARAGAVRPVRAGSRQRAPGARPRSPARHRQRRPRRAEPRDLGHPRVAGRRLRLRRDRRARRQPARHRRRLQRWARGRPGDARDGRGAVVPAPGARAGAGGGAGRGAHRRADRPRRRLHADVRAADARPS